MVTWEVGWCERVSLSGFGNQFVILPIGLRSQVWDRLLELVSGRLCLRGTFDVAASLVRLSLPWDCVHDFFCSTAEATASLQACSSVALFRYAVL
jgi:hypothetical protein